MLIGQVAPLALHFSSVGVCSCPVHVLAIFLVGF